MSGLRLPRALGRTVLCLTLAASAHAQDSTAVAHPFYRAEHALQGLYRHHLPPLQQRFQHEADALMQAARAHCQGPAQPEALREA